MGKIFSYNVDIDKTAYMNWRTRQHQPIHDMMIIADGYMKAAIMLAQDCLQDNGDKKADIVVFPMLFSANHAIELYLKSIKYQPNTFHQLMKITLLMEIIFHPCWQPLRQS